MKDFYLRNKEACITGILVLGMIVSVLGVTIAKEVNAPPTQEELQVEQNFEIIKAEAKEQGSNIKVTKNDKIQVKVEDKWVNLDDIEIVAWSSNEFVIKHGNKEIPVKDASLVNTFVFLDSLGSLD